MTGKHDIDNISLADNYLVHGGLHTIIKMFDTKFHQSVYGSLGREVWSRCVPCSENMNMIISMG